MSSPTDDRMDLFAVPFAFPDVAGKKVLVLGLGGGSDVITAYVVSTLLPGVDPERVVYANTKNGNVGPSEPISAHVVRVVGPVPEVGRRGGGFGRGRIDHSVPRADNGSPWIFLLADEEAEEALPDELRSLGFDLVIGVDTGGDSIAKKGGRGRLGRDQRMLGVIGRTGLPLFHVVVAPGSDGEASFADLQGAFHEEVDAGRYRGCFALDPVLPLLRTLSADLNPTRTPRIILAAADGQLSRTADGRVVVPRGKKPAVPREWLTNAFVFASG